MRLIDKIKEGGRTEEWYYDPVYRKFHTVSKYDTSEAEKLAKIYGDDPPEGPWWKHAAVIPEHVMEQAYREGWDKTDFKKWANDSNNKKFRTWPGKL